MAAAAHQVAMGLFYVTLPFGEANSQAAQAFLPAIKGEDARRRMRGRVLRMGTLTGLCTATLVCLPLALPTLTQAFTRDALILATIRALLPLVGTCAFCFSFASAAEGTLVAARDLRPIALLYASSPVLVFAALAVYRGPLGAGAGGIGLVARGFIGSRRVELGGSLVAWAAFASFHVTRACVFVGRAAAKM